MQLRQYSTVGSLGVTSIKYNDITYGRVKEANFRLKVFKSGASAIVAGKEFQERIVRGKKLYL
jgi:hypothetical protein